MAKVFNAPEQIKFEFSYSNFDRTKYDAAEQKYFNELSDFCKKRNPNGGEYIGERLRFPAADGYAEYVVANLKPVELVHCDIGDGWSYQGANRLTKKDVMQQVDSYKRLSELFSKK